MSYLPHIRLIFVQAAGIVENIFTRTVNQICHAHALLHEFVLMIRKIVLPFTLGPNFEFVPDLMMKECL